MTAYHACMGVALALLSCILLVSWIIYFFSLYVTTLSRMSLCQTYIIILQLNLSFFTSCCISNFLHDRTTTSSFNSRLLGLAVRGFSRQSNWTITKSKLDVVHQRNDPNFGHLRNRKESLDYRSVSVYATFLLDCSILCGLDILLWIMQGWNYK